MIHLSNLIINPTEIETINFNGSHEGRDCIDIKLKSGYSWFVFGDKKYRQRKKLELIQHLNCNRDSYGVLKGIKYDLQNKMGRKCKTDQEIIKRIESLI